MTHRFGPSAERSFIGGMNVEDEHCLLFAVNP
jgi:hypothetical protein